MKSETLFQFIVATTLCCCLHLHTLAQVSIVSASAQSTTSFTYNATAGSNRLLLVIVSAEYNGYNSVSSISWGNKSLTAIGGVTLGLFNYNHTSSFYLKDSDISSVTGNTMVISNSTGANIRSVSIKTIMLRNVLQSVPIAEQATNSNFLLTSISLNSIISSDNGDMVIAAVTSDRNNLSISSNGTGFNELFDLQSTHLSSAVSYRSISANWTNSSPSFTGNIFSFRMTMLAFEVNSTLNPLPVSFMDFTANDLEQDLVLAWNVAQEENNDFFTLEESNDLLNWNVVGTVQSLGNTTSVRSYDFDTSIPSQSMYYRLSQTDLDGSHSVLSTLYYKRKVIHPWFNNGDPINKYNCKAINFHGQIIATCDQCIPKEFMSDAFVWNPLFILEIERERENVFRGVVAVDGR
ncbi:MAG: hypothetical protein ACKVQV_15265 [Bacteroidia bacterium]